MTLNDLAHPDTNMRTLSLELVGLVLSHQATFIETWRTDLDKRDIESCEIINDRT